MSNTDILDIEDAAPETTEGAAVRVLRTWLAETEQRHAQVSTEIEATDARLSLLVQERQALIQRCAHLRGLLPKVERTPF